MMDRVLYKRGVSPDGGTVVIPVPDNFLVRRSFARRFVRGVGVGMVAIAFVGFSLLTYPFLSAQTSYYTRSISGADSEYNALLASAAQETVAVQEEAARYGVSPHFSVVIPSIDAKSDIVANVNAGDSVEYERALKEGVAHARGTYFPGQGENIFLFSHSTDSPYNYAQYNAVFYLLSKVEVRTENSEGDKIVVYFSDKKYVYEVESVHVVDPDDTSWFTKDFGGERLILQTCTPPGTVWKRLIVVAKPV